MRGDAKFPLSHTKSKNMSHRVRRLSGVAPLPKERPTTLVKHKRHTFPPTRFAKLGSLWSFPKNTSKPRRFEHGLFGEANVWKGYNVTFSDKRTKRFWKPNVLKLRLYSEILDRRLRIKCTAAVLRTIDRYGGLDNYLLKTPPQLLHSKFGRILRDILMEMKQLNAKQKEYSARVNEYAQIMLKEFSAKDIIQMKVDNTLHSHLNKMARAYQHLPQEQRELYEEHMSVLKRKNEIMERVDSAYANYLGRKEPAWSKQTMHVPSHLVAPEHVPDHMPIAEQFRKDNEDFSMNEILDKYTTRSNSNKKESA